MQDTPSPRVSVLLPTHNRADVLGFAIRSVLGQTFTDFELLVIGDGCTDATSEVIAGFEDERLRWFDLPKAPNFGYANRNLVLKEARGDLVAMMSHDDLWFPDHLEALVPCFEKPEIDLAHGRPLYVSLNGMVLPSTFNLDDPEVLATFLAAERNSLPSTCFVCRRSAIEAAGGFDPNLPHSGDLDLWGKVIRSRQARNFVSLSTPTCLHFRAAWRTDEPTWGAPELWHWRTTQKTSDSLPRALQAPPVPGQAQQETVWQAIEADPREWASEMRAATNQFLDRRIRDGDILLAEHEALLLEAEEMRRALASAEESAWQAKRREDATLSALGAEQEARRRDRVLFEAQSDAFEMEREAVAAERLAIASEREEALIASRRPGDRILGHLRLIASRCFPPGSTRGRLYAGALSFLSRMWNA